MTTTDWVLILALLLSGYTSLFGLVFNKRRFTWLCVGGMALSLALLIARM